VDATAVPPISVLEDRDYCLMSPGSGAYASCSAQLRR